jgi:hypothetical protein
MKCCFALPAIFKHFMISLFAKQIPGNNSTKYGKYIAQLLKILYKLMQMQKKIHFFGKRFRISLKFNYAAEVLINVITLSSNVSRFLRYGSV